MIHVKSKPLYALFCLGLAFGCNGSSATQDSANTNNSTDSVIALKEDFVSMLQPGSLAGWSGDTAYWRMEDDILIGEISADQPPLTSNTFLIWQGGEMGDFILKSDFKITENGNSGINYRSEQLQDPQYAMKGYQADIDGQHQYTGQNYEERNRTTLAYRGQRTEIQAPSSASPGESKNNAWTNLQVVDSVASPEELDALMQAGGWNEIKIVAEGNKLSHYINGTLVSETIDMDSQHRKDSGLIGVQVHMGPPMKVEYRNMQIKSLN